MSAAVDFDGAGTARPTSGRAGRDRATRMLVVIGPSNPIVSIGPMLELPGVREAREAASAGSRSARSSAGAALKGPADRMLA